MSHYEKLMSMNNLEYIQGDLVTNKYYTKVLIVFRIVNNMVYTQNQDASSEAYISHKDDVVPIPLTPEILEKNGWKKFKRPYSSDYRYKRKGYPTLNIRSEKEVYFHWGDHDKSITTVHQLQHLLFGLGINSEMEV